QMGTASMIHKGDVMGWYTESRLEKENELLEDNGINFQTVKGIFNMNLEEYAMWFYGDYVADMESAETEAVYNMLFWILGWLVDAVEYYRNGGKDDYPFDTWVSKEREKQ
ncbi:MAG: hypothetical protein LUE27_11050, partial [Clostridia bacterium]|nr:hypothetical protein [Clostridia bacterium]